MYAAQGILSGVFLVLSLTGTVASVRWMQAVERPRELISTSLAPGTHTLLFSRAGVCLGSVETSLKNSTQIEVTATASLPVRINALTSPATASISALFNPLGQLIELRTDLAHQRTKLQVRASSVNPIELSVALSGTNSDFSRKWKIPGPALIRRTTQGNYTLDYPPLSKFDNSPGGLMAHQLLSGLNVSIGDSQSCAPASGVHASLDLTPLTELLTRLISTMPTSEKARPL